MPIVLRNWARGGGTRTFDTDVLLWQGAVIANGGSVSLDYLIVVDQFVFAEKASGVWALTDDYFPLWAEDAGSALTSLKQRRLAVAVNSPTFVQKRGYTFDGVSQYIDTGFVPSLHAIVANGTLQRLEAYERINLAQTSAYAIGASNNSSRISVLNPRRATTGSAQIYLNATTFGASTLDSRGLTVGSTDGAIWKHAKNGAQLAVTPPTPGGAIMAAWPFFIGGTNTAGVATGFRPNSYGFAAFGAALSDAQDLAHYNAVQAMATSLGAQV